MKETPREMLNGRVYEKLCAEQKDFKKWWLAQSDDCIAFNAHRYVIQQDMLCAVEDMDLGEEECEVILSKEHPLRDMYNEFMGFETDYMDDIRQAIEWAIENVGLGLHLEAWKGEEVRISDV